MDFTAVMSQITLSHASNERLSAALADTAIQIACRMGATPQEVLRLAADKVGFTEDEWRTEVDHNAHELATVAKELYPPLHVMLRERYRISPRRRVKGTASR